MSDELREFLQWWLKEAESDNPNKYVIGYGLCFCLEKWSSDSAYLDDELQKALSIDDCPYPFGQTEYNERQLNDTMHQCPKRLAFVRKMLAGA